MPTAMELHQRGESQTSVATANAPLLPGSTTRPGKHPNTKGDRIGHGILVFWQFFRWLWTAIFLAFLLATLKIFENKDNFSSGQKTLFNVINIALSLALGLNFFVRFYY